MTLKTDPGYLVIYLNKGKEALIQINNERKY